MMLVMEFVGGGNLAKALSLDKAEPRRLGWYRNGRFVLLGIARGLAFIHSRNIIVFDIKAGNVLLDQDGVTAKITDVGLSKMLAGSNTATLLVRYPPACSYCVQCDSGTHVGLLRIPVSAGT